MFPALTQSPIRARRAVLRAATALLCAQLTGCGDGEGESSGPREVSVEVTTVGAGLLRDVVTFSGQLGAENSVMVKSENDGVIQEVLFEEGQDVEEGAVLFQLRNEEQRARVREAEANLALAHEVSNRTHKLAKRNAVSEAAKTEASAQLAVAKARVELAQVELDRTDIRAPFDGVLGMRMVAVGDFVSDETALVQIDAVDRLQVIFAISELGILFTQVGVPVQVTVAPYPDDVFPGEVFFVSPTVDPSTRRIIAKAWVANPERRLRAGLFAGVDMQIGERENAILIPEAAVVFDRRGTYVWRVDGESVARKVPVEVGLRRLGKVEITLGLQPGDRIVSAGVHKVQEGKPVVAVAPGASASGQARRPSPPAGGEGT